MEIKYHDATYLFQDNSIDFKNPNPKNIYFAPSIKLCKESMERLNTNQIRIFTFNSEEDCWTYYCDMTLN